jgi:hypothetical protein
MNLDIPSIYLAPMSKNIVDAIIDYNNNNEKSVGIIASRRQVDINGGYCNNWTTEEFVRYIKEKSPDTVVCRDHGGISQGIDYDDGIESLMEDANHMDIIHIDPFKTKNINLSIEYTVQAIETCMKINPKCYFEIGTEESIFPIDHLQLKYLIESVEHQVTDPTNIVYGVIQSGTALQSGHNTGNYDPKRMTKMMDICRSYGYLSKEHNGDYLSPKIIKEKFDLGLSAMNFAPEIAHIETEYIISKINDTAFYTWYFLVIKNGFWKKWFPENFAPENNKRDVLRLCGHYVFSEPDFEKVFDLNLASTFVTENIKEFINKRI